jgi:hypothetical protein
MDVMWFLFKNKTKKTTKIKLNFFWYSVEQYTKMTKFQVPLNFSFEAHYWDHEELDDDEDSKEAREKEEAYARTDAYYESHDIEDHVKSNDAMDFVSTLVYDGEILSAEWDKDKFAIHMVVETDQTAEELEEDLRDNSLEDGEYEACGDTGWVVMTRGPDGEAYAYPMEIRDFWEYGLTDYRDNPIEIVEMTD